MNVSKWTEIETYFTERLVKPDAVMQAALQHCDDEGLPSISITPTEGQSLQLLASIQGAKSILEIGTLGGYSTIWLARALPADGRLITLEYSARHAAVAAVNIARAGLSDRVEIRTGTAADTLAQLYEEKCGPFDFIFIDADKETNPTYLRWALKLSRPGSLIVCDNVVRDGEITNPNNHSASIQGIREFCDELHSLPQLQSTALQTVSSKGYDGFSISRVNAI